MPSLRPIHLASLPLLLACSGLLAQGADPAPEVASSAGSAAWTVSAGASWISVPRYLGADRRRSLLLPSFEARRADGLFVSFDRGIGLERPLNDAVRLNAALAVDLDARRRQDDARFAALATVREAPALRVGADADVGPWSLGTTLQSRLARRREGGTTVSADTTWAIGSGDAGQLGLGLTGRWADARYARTFLSLDAAQAAASGLPVYRAGAGLLEAGLLAQGVLRLGEEWTLFGRATASRLGSQAAGSPLVRTRRDRLLVVSASRSF